MDQGSTFQFLSLAANAKEEFCKLLSSLLESEDFQG